VVPTTPDEAVGFINNAIDEMLEAQVAGITAFAAIAKLDDPPRAPSHTILVDIVQAIALATVQTIAGELLHGLNEKLETGADKYLGETGKAVLENVTDQLKDVGGEAFKKIFEGGEGESSKNDRDEILALFVNRLTLGAARLARVHKDAVLKVRHGGATTKQLNAYGQRLTSTGAVAINRIQFSQAAHAWAIYIARLAHGRAMGRQATALGKAPKQANPIAYFSRDLPVEKSDEEGWYEPGGLLHLKYEASHDAGEIAALQAMMKAGKPLKNLGRLAGGAGAIAPRLLEVPHISGINQRTTARVMKDAGYTIGKIPLPRMITVRVSDKAEHYWFGFLVDETGHIAGNAGALGHWDSYPSLPGNKIAQQELERLRQIWQKNVFWDHIKAQIIPAAMRGAPPPEP
jgi:hypothetical protein